MQDSISFTRKLLCPDRSPPPKENSMKLILKKSKYSDGQRHDLSLAEGRDLLSSQMFEILPPACIIERNVLITLTWQLGGLPEPTLSRALIFTARISHCTVFVGRRGPPSPHSTFRAGGSTHGVPVNLGCRLHGSGPTLWQQKHQCNAWYDMLVRERREIPRK